jgi:hypothetical protein
MKHITCQYGIILLILIISLLPTVAAQQEINDAPLRLKSPDINKGIYETEPTITIEYAGPNPIDRNSVILTVDFIDVTEWEQTIIQTNQITHEVPPIFSWADGNHTIKITLEDTTGQTYTNQWTAVVNVSKAPLIQESSIDVFAITMYIIYGTIILTIGLFIYIMVLRQTKGFNFEKFFAQHPIQMELFIIIIPAIFAFLFILLGFLYVSTTPNLPPFSFEYVLIIGLFIGLSPYAVDAQLERIKKTKYERAFAQLLFELADAMRGGLDPAKAIIELAKTDTSILKDRIKIASDNIKLGRPFDHVMDALAKPIKSELVRRYATLIGDTSKIGGEPAQVIHRAAKDMDDFIKVDQERRRQLMQQATTIYIAFGVLLIVLYQLISMFPSLGAIDTSLMSGGASLDAAAAAAEGPSFQRMSFLTLKQRFFHLVIVNSIGTGTIIGTFIDGKIKYGLLHSLVLTASAVIFFIVTII